MKKLFLFFMFLLFTAFRIIPAEADDGMFRNPNIAAVDPETFVISFFKSNYLFKVKDGRIHLKDSCFVYSQQDGFISTIVEDDVAVMKHLKVNIKKPAGKMPPD